MNLALLPAEADRDEGGFQHDQVGPVVQDEVVDLSGRIVDDKHDPRMESVALVGPLRLHLVALSAPRE
jgi:hypothetical protein